MHLVKIILLLLKDVGYNMVKRKKRDPKCAQNFTFNVKSAEESENIVNQNESES